MARKDLGKTSDFGKEHEMRDEKRLQRAKTKTRRAKERSQNCHPTPTLSTTPEQRHRLIAENAYLRAASRGFCNGSALQDWLEAEAEIDAWLMSEGDEREAGMGGQH